jgi:hypothetical protein
MVIIATKWYHVYHLVHSSSQNNYLNEPGQNNNNMIT